MVVFDQLNKNEGPLKWLAVAVLSGLAVLIGGLWWIQIISFNRWTESERDQSYRTVRIPAIRGKILDRYGHVLAENRPSYNVSLYVEELRDRFEPEFIRLKNIAREQLGRYPNRAERSELARRARYNVMRQVVNRVSQILEVPIEIEEEEFRKHYEQLRALPMPLLTNLDSQLLARFLESPNLPPSVDLEVQPLRYYPQTSTAAHLLGYLGKDVSSRPGELASVNYRLPDYRGVVGLEATFDEELRGKAGVKSVLVNNLGYRQSETIWFPSEPGNNLVLSLDLDIQQAAENALQDVKNSLRNLEGDEVRGAAVVLDVRNGDILAMVSAPAFDPNQFVPSISSREMKALLDPDSTPLFNRASMGTYQPGSVFKIITALACLQAGVLNEQSLTNQYFSPGYYQISSNRRIRDEADPGYYDFKRAFIKSSNTYFIHYGLEAGIDPLQQVGLQFHFGESMELPTRANSSGIFPDDAYLQKLRSERGIYWSKGDTANLCIGQGFIDVTPIQIAVMISAIANGGTVYQPRLVHRVEPMPDAISETEMQTFEPTVLGRLDIPERHLAIMREAMRADVSSKEGTGWRAEVPGMNVSGKTGTAERKKGGAVVRKDVWFASFAPYEDPHYAVVVMVEGGHFGGTTSAPVAQKIYEALKVRDEILSRRAMVQR